MSQVAWRLDTLALETVGFWALVMVSGSSKVVHACMLSWVQLFATLWTVACQAPLSVEYSRQEYWSGLLCPPPGNLPDPGIEPTSLASPALADGFFFFFFFYHRAAWEVRDCGWESNAHPTVPLRRIPEFSQCN